VVRSQAWKARNACGWYGRWSSNRFPTFHGTQNPTVTWPASAGSSNVESKVKFIRSLLERPAAKQESLARVEQNWKRVIWTRTVVRKELRELIGTRDYVPFLEFANELYRE